MKRRIIGEAEARTIKVFNDNNEALLKLVEALLERETLDRRTVQELLKDYLHQTPIKSSP